MNARERVAALRTGQEPQDGYGQPLVKNSLGEWVNGIGDTPCPTDGEMTNRRCWKCGWTRQSAAAGRTFAANALRREDAG